MELPLVSVIIPTYNRVDYVQDAIDSVLQQSYKNFELIVIDDGSTDNTWEVLNNKYAEKLRCVFQKNQGESEARNNGINLANGEYIAFLDSDDYWEKDKLEEQVKALEPVKNDRFAAVYSSVWLTDSFGKLLHSEPSGRVTKQPNPCIKDLFSGPKIIASPSNLLIKTKALKKVGGFDPTIKYGEDWDLVLRLRSHWYFIYIDKPLLYYRIHKNNQQRNTSPEQIRAVFDDHIKIIKKNAAMLNFESKDFVIAAKIRENEFAAYSSLSQEFWEQGINYLQQANYLNGKPIHNKRLSENIGFHLATKAIEIMNVNEFNCDNFIISYINQFKNNWCSSLGKFPEQSLRGWFYHNLAFLSIHSQGAIIRKLCFRSIIFEPRLLLSYRTLLSILKGSVV